MSSNQWIMLITMLVYMSMMVAIGFYVSKKNTTASGFFLGGRTLGPYVTAMSAEASDMSGWLLMGLPAVAMMCGLAEATWTAIGLAIGTYINWLIVAKRLRLYSAKVDAFTIPDFFARRFGDKRRILTLVSALFIVIFFIPYTASGFAACGKLFSALFGMDYTLAMILSAVVIVTYCTLGGFLAASLTDFIQSIVMTIALLIVLGLGEGLTGGFGQVFDNVKNVNVSGYLDIFKGYDPLKNEASTYGFLPVVSTLAWGLGYFGMPHVLLRFMGIEDANKLKVSRRVASIWVVISMGIAVLIGVAGFSLLKEGIIGPYEPDPTADNLLKSLISDAETIIVDIASYLSNFGIIPSITAGIILAGILASTMSTADSQLLAASSSISQNLLVETFHIKMNEKTNMWIARFAVIEVSLIAVLLAMNPDSSVFEIVSFAWAGFGAAFGPIMLCALFWKRTTLPGAIAGMITGGAMVFIWKFLIAKLGDAFAIYELLPAFVLALIVTVVVSLCTKAPSKEITDAFDDVQKSVKAKN